MWLEHIRRRGWQAVAAVEVTAAEQAEAADTTALPSAAELSNAPMLGVAYGYPGRPASGGNSRWYWACNAAAFRA